MGAQEENILFGWMFWLPLEMTTNQPKPSRSLEANMTNELHSVRVARQRAFQSHQRHSGPSRWFLACVVQIFTFPVVLAERLFTAAFIMATSALRPHFWVGVFVTTAAFAWFIKTQCVEQSFLQDDGVAKPIVVVCTSDETWVWQARDHFQALHALGAGVVSGLTCAFETFTEFFWGRSCPFRNIEDARVFCAGQREFQAVRHALDCMALRRAYHDGQRQFHADHLRVRHPGCKADILEACSIALNLAAEVRRAELPCRTGR